MASRSTVETVWCGTCQTKVVAHVERYLSGTSMARCPWCSKILHPPAEKARR
jgi:DNA-directed RNA polymerase subunit RPC12/RpoP